jgi:predicted RNA polymerase sigma factor
MNYLSLIFNESGEAVKGEREARKGIGKEAISVPSFLRFMSSLSCLA